MKLSFTNFAKSYLATAVTNANTSLTLAPGTGIKFPSPTGGSVFFVVLKDIGETVYEVAKVTGRAGDVLTVERGAENTVALSWGANTIIEHVVTAGVLSDQTTNSTDGVSFDTIQLNTATSSANAVGKLRWNDTDGTMDLGLKGGSSVLQVGQEHVLRVVNKSGVAMTNGKVVYVSGAQGNRVTVSLAMGDTEFTSQATIGILTEDVNNNNEGFCTLMGLVRDIDTSAFAEGAALFLSDVIPGGITATAPIAPHHAVRLGWCVRSHAVNGSILVHVQNGYELDELHDVYINSIADGQILQYNASQTRWQNSGIDAAGIVTKTGNQTIAGVKTFSSLPILPGNATTNMQPVPKQQLDAAFASMTATSVFLKEAVVVSGTSLSGTVDIDASAGGVFYFTGNSTANWIPNIVFGGSTIDSKMNVGQSLTLTVLATQGSTAYLSTTLKIDGNIVAVKWQGGTLPTTGNANSIDVYGYSIIKTAANTFTVLGSQTRFA